MTDRELLEQIIGELKSLNQRVGGLEVGQNNLATGQKGLESSLKKLQKDVTTIKRDLNGVWGDIKRLDQRTEKQREELDALKG